MTSSIPFTNSWLQGQTGFEMLERAKDIEKKLQVASRALVKKASASRTPGLELVSEATLSSLTIYPVGDAMRSLVPRLTEKEKGLRTGEIVYVEIQPLKLKVTSAAARLLSQINENIEKVLELDKAVCWLRSYVRQVDDSLCERLLSWALTTNTFDLSNKFSTYMTLCSDLWLSDAAIEAILDIFNDIYGKGGERVFVNSSYIRESDRDKASSPTATQIFCITHYNNHWGVTYFSVADQTIAFGDSLDTKTPKDIIEDVIDQLFDSEDDHTRSHEWRLALDSSDEKFVVDKQSDETSCGVLAIFAIERFINPDIESDDSGETQNLRVRYLRLLSKHMPVLLDDTKPSSDADTPPPSATLDDPHHETQTDPGLQAALASQSSLSPSEDSYHESDASPLPSTTSDSSSHHDHISNVQGALTPQPQSPPHGGSEPAAADKSQTSATLTTPPRKGQEFPSVRVAKRLLKCWALGEGFKLRTRSFAPGHANTISLICHRGGNSAQSPKAENTKKSSKNTNCMCVIKVHQPKSLEGACYIASLNLEHNHPMNSAKTRKLKTKTKPTQFSNDIRFAVQDLGLDEAKVIKFLQYIHPKQDFDLKSICSQAREFRAQLD